MTCYFRHKLMKDVFTKAGVEVTKENRKEIDRIIHSIVWVDIRTAQPRGRPSRNTWLRMRKPS